jgi:hypothetical protein
MAFDIFFMAGRKWETIVGSIIGLVGACKHALSILHVDDKMKMSSQKRAQYSGSMRCFRSPIAVFIYFSISSKVLLFARPFEDDVVGRIKGSPWAFRSGRPPCERPVHIYWLSFNMGPCPSGGRVDWISQWCNYSLIFVRLEWAFVDWNCALIKGYFIYHLGQGVSGGGVIPTICVGVYDHVFAMCECWIFNYCHFLFDIFPAVLWIPEAILRQGHFVLPIYGDRRRFIHEALCWVGLGNRCIILDQNHYISARAVYHFEPYSCGGREDPVLLTRLRQFITDRFGLDRKIPDRRCFMNRARGLSRHIINLHEVVALCARRYPTVTWEWIDSTASIGLNAKRWNELDFFFAPHGAGSANTLFMQPRTVYCEIQSGGHANFIHAALIVGIFPLTYRLPGMRHFDPTMTNVLPLNKAEELLEKAVSYLENRGTIRHS